MLLTVMSILPFFRRVITKHFTNSTLVDYLNLFLSMKCYRLSANIACIFQGT